ncbi:hypothetical protein MMPV_002760 [Pyropia vietnamensis]
MVTPRQSPPRWRRGSATHALCLAALAAVVVGAALPTSVSADSSHHEDEPINTVSYHSAIKLAHDITGFRLHSHAVAYGSGSRQQSVTGMESGSDVNSVWVVRAGHDAADPAVGTPVSCGETIRLMHVNTAKHLHTHQQQAPMGLDWEVSAFALGRGTGDGDEGPNGRWAEGDHGDDWVVVCEGKAGEDSSRRWLRGEGVFLKHAVSGRWLTTSARHTFGEPVAGQQMVAATKKKGPDGLWRTAEGVYFSPAHVNT